MKRVLVHLVAAGAFASSASAQQMGWSTIIPSVAGTDVLGLVLREKAEQSRSGRTAPPQAGSESRREAPAPNVAALDYTPSRARRITNLARFVGKSRAIDPGNAEEMERLFASGDFIDRVGDVLTPMGLRVDNVADAYAIWWITAWNAYRGEKNNPSRAMSEAVSAQAARALAARPEILGASDAQKQELAEALLTQMTFITMTAGQHRNDPAQLRALAAAVDQGARRMGLDLSSMQLTEEGFRPRRAP